MRIVLSGRSELSLDVGSTALMHRLATVTDGDLAFTVDGERARPGRRAGHRSARAVELTGGWVAGVLFEAWRSAEHDARSGGESDPLYGYLSSSQILEQLPPEEREFLVATPAP